jgi:hypothetical protein
MTAYWQRKNRIGCRRECNRGLVTCGLCFVAVLNGFGQFAVKERPAPAAATAAVAASTCEQITRGAGRYARLRHGGIETSEDKFIWTERPLLTRTFLRGLAYGHGLFVAVGGSYVDAPGIIVTSRDGVTWRERKGSGKSNLYGVAFDHGLFVAVGESGAICTSVDGVRWRSRPSGVSATLLATVVAGNGIFVGGGDCGTIVTSTNGVDWTLTSLGAPVYVGTIRFRDGAFVINDASATFTSTNGLTWRRGKAQALAARSFSLSGEIPILKAALPPGGSASPPGRAAEPP